MNPELIHRPKWPIDRLLDSLLGQNIRVAARAFVPAGWNGRVPTRFQSVRDLYLPDNTQPVDRPVFFEGRLQRFERQISIVFVELQSPTAPKQTTEATVDFRDTTAIILQGPAIVELAFPFRVEPTTPTPVHPDVGIEPVSAIVPAKLFPSEPEPPDNQRNHRFLEADRLDTGSLKQKCPNNLAALELPKRFAAEHWLGAVADECTRCPWGMVIEQDGGLWKTYDRRGDFRGVICDGGWKVGGCRWPRPTYFAYPFWLDGPQGKPLARGRNFMRVVGRLLKLSR
jgi:hypothetical protein